MYDLLVAPTKVTKSIVMLSVSLQTAVLSTLLHNHCLILGLLGFSPHAPPTTPALKKILITELCIWYVYVGISILAPNMYLTLKLVKYCCQGNYLYESVTCTT